MIDVILDDMLIKLWDWDKKWTCTQVFEGHTHYVMQIVINPKDNNTFASASLDRTVKVSLIFYAPTCLRGHLDLLLSIRNFFLILWQRWTSGSIHDLYGHISSSFFF